MKPKNKGKQNKNKNDVRNDFKIKDINGSTIGKKGTVTGIISSINQTSGPTLFSVNDGTGSLVLKGFESPGERAYPNLKEDDVVKAFIKVNEYQGEFEGEIFSIRPLLANEAQKVKEEIQERIRKKAKPKEIDFLVKSKILDKLKESFIKAATEIRLAIMQDRPIIVRHHNDADGYSSGYTLERAIIPLVEEQHGFGKSAWEFFSRAPCQAPFYEIDDSIRDTANSLRNMAKFSNKMPLVIIADNGSSPEDLMAIKQAKVHGIDFIVVDHHYFDKDVISAEVLSHINPFLVGEDGTHYSAGMLCTELARFINSEVKNIEQIPAMAGVADRIDNPEVIDAYLKIAESKGYDKKLLGEIAILIDFVSRKLRFMEAREYIEVLFGHPMDRQKELVKLMTPYLENLSKKGLEMARMGAEVEKVGSVYLQMIDIDKTFPGFGFYPRPGICIELIHDDAYKGGKKKLVTVGHMNTALTMRATDEANFSVHELIEFLNKKVPDAFIEGGGHKNAGSVNFIPRKKEEVVKLLKEFIKSR